MIKFENVRKEFKTKKSETLAVDNVNLEIQEGEIFGIIGFSGAGKSTLVRCINLLEVPSSGKVYFKNENLLELTGKQLRQYRRKVGMIFQQFNLLEQKNVLDNICYPLLISGVKKKEARQRAYELLELVEMTDKAKAYPSQLSGGQKQRVAIARALATEPEILLCDEATSALDPITTKSILQLLKDINQKLKVTIVVITHELKVVETICDRVAVMSAGKVEEVETVKELFLNPKSETARKLILSSDTDAKKTTEKKSLRIVFEGQAASEPIISKLTLNTNMMINILGANTEDIGGKAYGQMLIELPDDELKAKKLRDELVRMGIHVEEG